ncbi:hypothetical protein DFP73DRAFT_596019 [Morchella snyderi]|nr:hypothetical protein DFP73DRAFT_596019 [Morchella snyderi]
MSFHQTSPHTHNSITPSGDCATVRSYSNYPIPVNSDAPPLREYRPFRITRPTQYAPGGDIAVPWDWLHGGSTVWDTRVDPDILDVREALDDLTSAVRKLVQDHSDLNHDPKRISDARRDQEAYWALLVRWYKVTAPAEVVQVYVKVTLFWREGHPGGELFKRHPITEKGSHWYGKVNRVNRILSPLLSQWNDLLEWCECFAASTRIVKCLNPDGKGARCLPPSIPIVDLEDPEIVRQL